MRIIVLLVFVFIILGIVVFIISSSADKADRPGKKGSRYLYQRKQWFMSKNEHDVFDAIVIAVGDKYHVFPQVKFDKILDWKGNGKNSIYAMRHINQKSVDFLLCDKTYINPRLAIELDDTTHEREDRKERDEIVEGILSAANFPLLRIHYSDTTNSSTLKEKIIASI